MDKVESLEDEMRIMEERAAIMQDLVILTLTNPNPNPIPNPDPNPDP